MHLSNSQRRKVHAALDEVIDEMSACTRLASTTPVSWPEPAQRRELDLLSARISKLEDVVGTMIAEAEHQRFRRSQTVLMLVGLAATMAVYAAIQLWLP